MNIRPATKFDLENILEMIISFSKQSVMPSLLSDDALDLTYLKSLLQHIIVGAGILLVAEKNNKTIGFIIGMKNNNIWYPKQIILSELMIWVEPANRHEGIACELITEYNKKAEIMRQNNQITMYTMTKTKYFVGIDFEQYGYNKIEETWAMGI
jgi:N-acetylglutamate synthase-like GNAT family acetyltransferase